MSLIYIAKDNNSFNSSLGTKERGQQNCHRPMTNLDQFENLTANCSQTNFVPLVVGVDTCYVYVISRSTLWRRRSEPVCVAPPLDSAAGCPLWT